MGRFPPIQVRAEPLCPLAACFNSIRCGRSCGPWASRSAQPIIRLAMFQVEHRFGRGFSFLANYTISKLLQDVGAIDNQASQGPSQQAFPQAGLPISDIYGIAPQDISQKFLFNYSVEIPVGKGKRFLGSPQSVGSKILDNIAGGWRAAGTTTYRTGQPVLIYTPSGGVGGLGSQWYNIGQGRTTRPRFVTP